MKNLYNKNLKILVMLKKLIFIKVKIISEWNKFIVDFFFVYYL